MPTAANCFTPDTLLTLEQKNLLADATNPNIKLAFSSTPNGNDYTEFDPNHNPILNHNRRDEPSRWNPRVVYLTFKERVQRDPRTTQLCAILLLLWLLVALLASGVLMYRYFLYKPTYYGWYGTNYVNEGITEHLEQKMEIDSNQLFERIQVPKFGMNRKTIYIHDFKKNVTAIVDVIERRCFLKELDHNIIPLPKVFIDLITEFQENNPKVSKTFPRVVRETYRVGSRVAKSNMLMLNSPMINVHCMNKDVFSLQRISRSMESPIFYRRKKRGNLGKVINKFEQPQSLFFSEYQGGNVIQDQIIL
uniref:Integral membrane protein 2 n=1 Tax=Rhabditophanes sp. KR3021 TaxID=114890 RepID=A0AC35UAW4_9BILA